MYGWVGTLWYLLVPEIQVAAGSHANLKGAVLHVEGELAGAHRAQGTPGPHGAHQLAAPSTNTVV